MVAELQDSEAERGLLHKQNDLLKEQLRFVSSFVTILLIPQSSIVANISTRKNLECTLNEIRRVLRESERYKERTALADNIEYIKNIVVKFLETNDTSVLPALTQALQLSAEDTARVTRGQTRGVLKWFG